MSSLLDNQPATYVKQIRKKLLVYSTSSLNVVMFAVLLHFKTRFNCLIRLLVLLFLIIKTKFVTVKYYFKKLLALKWFPPKIKTLHQYQLLSICSRCFKLCEFELASQVLTFLIPFYNITNYLSLPYFGQPK